MADFSRLSSIPGRLDTFEVEDSFTRLDNATAYASGDAIGDSTAVSGSTNLVFANIAASNGGVVFITQALLITSVAAGNLIPLPELWLFNAEPTKQVDNSAFSLVSATDLSKLITVLPLEVFSIATNLATLETASLNRFVKCAAGTTTIWGQVKAMGAHTPAALNEFTFRLQGYLL